MGIKIEDVGKEKEGNENNKQKEKKKRNRQTFHLALKVHFWHLLLKPLLSKALVFFYIFVLFYLSFFLVDL